MDNHLIGARLRALRLSRGTRQADVARSLGISAAYLNLIEKGKRTIQFPLLWKALELLEQDLEGFMSSLGEKRPDDALARLLDDPWPARSTSTKRTSTSSSPAQGGHHDRRPLPPLQNTRAQLDTAVASVGGGDAAPRLRAL